MKRSLIAILATAVAAGACAETTSAPDVAPTFHVTATVTEANDCAVNALNHSYSSKGQIRGDVPSKFVGTVAVKSYHGFGCWVSTSGGDGDLIVLFSGNTLGKALEPGTYPLVREVLDDTPLGRASVSFRTSEIGDKLVSLDGNAGTVVVELTASGGRVIKVNADLSRWGNVF